MLGTKSPIFIVGCTNSGTKCLFLPLREHQDVGGMDKELHWLGVQPNLDGRLNRLFALFPCFNTNHAHKESILKAYGGGPMGKEEVESLIGWFRKHRKKHWKNGSRLLTKDPKLSLRLTWIKLLWPDAIIMGMVRNPWSVVEGIIRRQPLMGDVALNLDVPTATAQWINVNTVLWMESKEIDSFMWIRYEDLIKGKTYPDEKDAKRIWSQILKHCELDKEGLTIPNASKFSEFTGERDGESHKNLSAWEIEFISTATEGLRKKLGYENCNTKILK